MACGKTEVRIDFDATYIEQSPSDAADGSMTILPPW